MPAISFEKISSPARGPARAIETRERGVVSRLIDRFVVVRIRREAVKAQLSKPPHPAK